MPNYYVFKGKRLRHEYIAICEDGTCIGMQESGYIDATKFSKWMSCFFNYHEKKNSLSRIRRFMLISDGHKSHVTLDVLLKAREHGVDMVSLPSHSSHDMEPLDISYFKPFK